MEFKVGDKVTYFDDDFSVIPRVGIIESLTKTKAWVFDFDLLRPYLISKKELRLNK